MPNSGRDIEIFENCQYVMGTFEFHKKVKHEFGFTCFWL